MKKQTLRTHVYLPNFHTYNVGKTMSFAPSPSHDHQSIGGTLWLSIVAMKSHCFDW